MPTPQQTSRVRVTVVALAEGLDFTKELLVPAHQTLGWAVNASGLLARYPQLEEAKLGVWGKSLPPETLVEAGDRIEVYCPINPQAVVAHRARLKAEKDARKAPPAP